METGQARQRAWMVHPEHRTVDSVLTLADALQRDSKLGQPDPIGLVLAGSPDGIRINADPATARSEIDGLSDRSFISANLNAAFPAASNLDAKIALNFALGNASVTLQNGTEAQAEQLFQLAEDHLPSMRGPTADEAARKSKRLSGLLKDAKATLASAKDTHEAATRAKAATEEVLTRLDAVRADAEKASAGAAEVQEALQTSSAALAEVRNLKTQIEADREAVLQNRDEVGATEARIRQFFESIDSYETKIKEVSAKADAELATTRSRTDEIVKENATLQTEIREHLLKAVGASLFSAFDRRKGRLERSKWVWAGITMAAVIAQVGVFLWLAAQVRGFTNDQSIFQQPALFLRATASLPIIFLIAYAINQYARERDFEELYAFKSALSFSLSPYIDLVRRLVAEPDGQKHAEFVIKTVAQIFDNPATEMHKGPRARRGDVRGVTQLLEQLIKLNEEAGRQ